MSPREKRTCFIQEREAACVADTVLTEVRNGGSSILRQPLPRKLQIPSFPLYATPWTPMPRYPHLLSEGNG